DLGEDEPDLRGRARDAEVAGERDDGAGADGDAVDRGDDRTAQRADVANERAGHASELDQALHVAREELADDALDVTTRAERPAFARDDAGTHGVLAIECGERIAELLVDPERERVEALRTGQRDRRDAARKELVLEGLGLDRHGALTPAGRRRPRSRRERPAR